MVPLVVRRGDTCKVVPYIHAPLAITIYWVDIMVLLYYYLCCH